jgi:hypothetical protein
MGSTIYKKLDGRSISASDSPYLYSLLQQHYHSSYVPDVTDKQVVGVDVTKDPQTPAISAPPTSLVQQHVGSDPTNVYTFDFSDVVPEHSHTYTTQNWGDKAQSKSYDGARNDKYKYMTNTQSKY